jgi:hypothetical protein
MTNKLIKSAKAYLELGIPAIPLDANKRSILYWKKYQEQLPTADEIDQNFSSAKTVGLAIITGKISGNMEAIDVDCKYDLTGTLFDDMMQRVVDEMPDVAAKLVIAKTVNGGYHIIYRSPKIEGNRKLASRETTEEEKAKNPHEKHKALIETRGEAGYIAAVPTPGYSFTSNSIREIPVLTSEERDHLHEIARSFNQVVEMVSHKSQFIEQKPMSKSPFADYNERGDIVQLLTSHGWKFVYERNDKVYFQRPGDTQAKTSGDFHRVKNIFAVFTSSTIFEVNKGYKPCAVFTILECNGDYKQSYKKLLAAGFGEPFRKIGNEQRRFVEKQLSTGMTPGAAALAMADKFAMTEEDAEKIVNAVVNEEEAGINEFWDYNEALNKVALPRAKFVDFLESNGFGLYFYDQSSPVFKVVHNDRNRLTEVSSERLRKFIKDYLMLFEPESGVLYPKQLLLECVYKDTKLFGDDILEFVNHVNPDFLRDSKDVCYYPFNNGIVEITANSMKLLNYGDVNKVIWKSDIRDANIDLEPTEDFECEFSDFIFKVCGQDPARTLSAVSIIGYLLHKYKHPANAFAVILCEETEDDAKGGGTGKGLFVKAIEHMTNIETIDGKNFKMDKSFAFQRVKMDTKIVAIQDIQKNFNFELFYSIITEGITIEKKNQAELFINYEDSPKVMFTSNYGMNDSGNHAKRRQKTIEFSDYFGPGKSPADEYGHLMYADWDKDEWNRFYNYMFYCVKYYLEFGVTDVDQGDKYKRKKVSNMFTPEFTEWYLDLVENDNHEWHQTSALYNDFLNVNDWDKKEYSQKRFKLALKVASENFNIGFESKKNRQAGGKYENRFLKKI